MAVERPPGITALALLNLSVWISSIFLVLAFLALRGAPAASSTVRGVLVLIIGSSVIHLAASIGLWRLKPYGRWLEMFLSFGWLFLFPLGTLVAISIWVYFSRPDVKALFSQDSGKPSAKAQLAVSQGRPLRRGRWPIYLSAAVGSVLIAPSLVLFLMTSKLLWPRLTPGMRQVSEYREILKDIETAPGFTELAHLPVASVALSDLPRGSSSLIFEVMIREKDLEGDCSPSIRVEPGSALVSL